MDIEEMKKNIPLSGTSLVGIVCSDGIVMAGDKKATLGGQIVVDKHSEKVVKINEYVLVSGTGVVSDIQMVKKVLKAQLSLKQITTGKRPSIKEAANLLATMAYNNMRQPSMMMFVAGMMMGGLSENNTAELYSVSPDGSITKIEDYDANISSGMPYILGLLERQYKKGMTVKEGVILALEAIKSSSQRDTASGYGIDVFTITKDGIKQVAKQELDFVYRETK